MYELRGKLSEGEVLHDFVADEQRSRLVGQLDSLEQWLYDEGEDQNRQVRLRLSNVCTSCAAYCWKDKCARLLVGMSS